MIGALTLDHPEDGHPAESDARYDRAIDRALRGTKGYSRKFAKELSRVSEGRAAREKDPSPRFWPSKANLLRGWSQIQVKIEEAFALRYQDPEYMLARMDLIAFEVEQLDTRDYPPAMLADFRARVFAERANAYRLQDNFRAAEADFARAQEFLDHGTGDLLAAARVYELIASLRNDQRRFKDAESFLRSAERMYCEAGEEHLAGRMLVKRGLFTLYEGNPSLAIEILLKAEGLLDPKEEPKLFASARQNRIQALIDAGRPREAAELLLQSGLRDTFRDDPINLARLRGTEGCLYVALGQYEKAERAFLEVRRVFVEHGNAFNAAIASLDLASVWLAQGKLAAVVETAEALREIFEDLGIYREAVMATRFLAEAVMQGTFPAAAALANVRQFFTRLDREPATRFSRPPSP
jgi:tetratricopeptide (TPR) repeat protein